jgi:hypothetical protein
MWGPSFGPRFGTAPLCSGDAVLQVRCPYCDAPIETHTADARGMAECARCGHSFPVDGQLHSVAKRAASDEAPGVTVHLPSLPGKHVFRLMQSLVQRPAFLLRAKTNRAASGSQSRQAGRKLARRRRFGLLARPELRRMFFAAITFLGIPAALIFFVFVVLAPKEDPDARRPVRAERPRTAKLARPAWLQKIKP